MSYISPIDQSHHLEPKTSKITSLCISSVTLVALAAIALLVVGALAIKGVGIFNHWPWQGGAAFLATGAAGCIGIMIFSLIRYCEKSAPTWEQKMQQFITNWGEATQPTSTQPKHVDTFQRETALEQICSELGITDLEQHMQALYKNSVDEFKIFLEMAPNELSLRCVLYTNEQFLQTPLITFDFHTIGLDFLLISRLELIDSMMPNRVVDTNIWKTTAYETRTLADLRSADVHEVLSSPHDDFFFCYGIFTAEQLCKYFEERPELTTSLLQKLLPLDWPQTKLTKERLKKIDANLIVPYISLLPYTYYRYLQPECFQLTAFPWDTLCSYGAFAETFRTSAEFTKKAFQLVPIDMVCKLAPFFTIDHMKLLPPDRIKDPSFPWQEFIKKKGVGNALHYFSSNTLLESYIPWESFEGDEFNNLFSLRKLQSEKMPESLYDFTICVLEKLNINIVSSWFKNKQLTEEHKKSLSQGRRKELDLI